MKKIKKLQKRRRRCSNSKFKVSRKSRSWRPVTRKYWGRRSANKSKLSSCRSRWRSKNSKSRPRLGRFCSLRIKWSPMRCKLRRWSSSLMKWRMCCNKKIKACIRCNSHLTSIPVLIWQVLHAPTVEPVAAPPTSRSSVLRTRMSTCKFKLTHTRKQ